MPSTGAAKSGDEMSVFAEHEGELAMLGAFGVLLAGRSGGGFRVICCLVAALCCLLLS